MGKLGSGSKRRRLASVGAVGNAAMLAAKLTDKAIKFASTTGEATSSAPAVATEHNQTRTMFKKRKLSKRGKKAVRRRKRFEAKVDKVINKNVYAPRSFVYQALGQVSAAPGLQAIYSISLSGYSGSSVLPPLNQHDDVADIFGSEGLTTGSDVLYLKSARLDCSLSVPNTEETAIVDAYEFFFRSTVPDNYNVAGVVPETIISNILSDAAVQGGAATAIATTDLGWNPMTNGLVGKYIKVVNHTRFVLGGGQHVTYTIKDKVNKRISLADAQASSFEPFTTKCVIFTVSGRPNAAPAGDTMVLHYPAVNLVVSATKTYWYNRISVNLSRVGENV